MYPVTKRLLSPEEKRFLVHYAPSLIVVCLSSFPNVIFSRFPGGNRTDSNVFRTGYPLFNLPSMVPLTALINGRARARSTSGFFLWPLLLVDIAAEETLMATQLERSRFRPGASSFQQVHVCAICSYPRRHRCPGLSSGIYSVLLFRVFLFFPVFIITNSTYCRPPRNGYPSHCPLSPSPLPPHFGLSRILGRNAASCCDVRTRRDAS